MAALACVGRKAEARAARTRLRLTELLSTYEWFGDYYAVFDWLADLVARPAPAWRDALVDTISAFAARRGIPLFRALARRWAAPG